MIKKFFTENLWLKTSSLILAITLWVFVTSRGQSEISIVVPVGFKNIPKDLVIMKQEPKFVTLRIEGYERLLRRLNPGNVHIFLDLSKAVEKDNIIDVTGEDVSMPTAIRVTGIEPSAVKLNMEKRMEKTVSVELALSGEPQKGFAVSQTMVSPKEIMTDGPRSVLRRFNSLKTEPLDITNASETIMDTIKIDKGGRDINVSPEEVTVKVVIGKTSR